jgi:hypothetical protein
MYYALWAIYEVPFQPFTTQAFILLVKGIPDKILRAKLIFAFFSKKLFHKFYPFP